MGSQSSTVTTLGIVTEHKPLTPQRSFEATIHKRFVRAENTTLEFDDLFFNDARCDHELEIRDVTHKRVLFRVPPPSSTSSTRQLLLDAYGVAVVGMEPHAIEPPQAQATEFAVIPGGPAATEELVRFTTQFNSFDHRLTLAFNHYPNSPDRVRIFVVGNKQWLARSAGLAIQRDGPQGDIFLIAQQMPVDDIRDGRYQIEVAAGVDVALIALLAAAMDEMSHKYATSIDRNNVKIQVKVYLKAQKKERKRQLAKDEANKNAKAA